MDFIHYIVSSSRQTVKPAGSLNKGMIVRFGRMVYKVKYLSTKIKNKKSKPANLNKVLPEISKNNIELDFERNNHMRTNNEEAVKMVHDSLANNSALALTID